MTQIIIEIDLPVMRLEKYCSESGYSIRTGQSLVAKGELFIMPKMTKQERPMVNLVAEYIKSLGLDRVAAESIIIRPRQRTMPLREFAKKTGTPLSSLRDTTGTDKRNWFTGMMVPKKPGQNRKFPEVNLIALHLRCLESAPFYSQIAA